MVLVRHSNISDRIDLIPFLFYCMYSISLQGTTAAAFSITNQLYRIHWCKYPKPGPLGCGPPICTPSSMLSQCKEYYSCQEGEGGSSSGDSCSFNSGQKSGGGGGKGTIEYFYDGNRNRYDTRYNSNYYYHCDGGEEEDCDLGSVLGNNDANGEHYLYRKCGDDEDCNNGFTRCDVSTTTTTTTTTASETASGSTSCDYLLVCDNSGHGDSSSSNNGNTDDDECSLIHLDDICKDRDAECLGFFNYYYDGGGRRSHSNNLDALKRNLPFLIPCFCIVLILMVAIFNTKGRRREGQTSEKAIRVHPMNGILAKRMLLFSRMLPSLGQRRRHFRFRFRQTKATLEKDDDDELQQSPYQIFQEEGKNNDDDDVVDLEMATI